MAKSKFSLKPLEPSARGLVVELMNKLNRVADPPGSMWPLPGDHVAMMRHTRIDDIKNCF